MAREARRLRDLVSQLLDAQRLERGAAVIDRAPADLRDVVESVRRRYAEHGLDLKADVPSSPVISAIDLPRFAQVIDNLVENAIKYTADGTLPELELTAEGDVARVSVVDHGVGVPEEERERIFERFYRATKRPGAARGRHRARPLHLPPDRGGARGQHLGRRGPRGRQPLRRDDPTPGGAGHRSRGGAAMGARRGGGGGCVT